MNTSAISPPAGGQAGAAPAAGSMKQPRGLYVLFLAEMWERFSYYGMRALLVLYLVNALHWPRGEALHVYGIYTGLVYLTPLIGGYIADKWLGARMAAVIGGTVMMLGHFAMAVPSLLNVALGLLIVGNGFFKPNTSSMVGMLYPTQDDPRRAGGYTIFYMGINLGAFFSPLVAGTLGEVVGWHYGFASAGVGMALGLVNFLWMQKWLGRAGLRDDQQGVGMKELPAVLAWTVASVAFVYLSLGVWSVVGPALEKLPLLVRLALGAAIVILAFKVPGWFRKDSGKDIAPLTRAEKGRVLALAIVAFFVIFFWMGFEQAGGSMNLFADKQTDRHLLGWEIPASWFQSINPVIIVLLGPVFAALWTWLNQTRWAISDNAKQGWGMVVLGLGFVVMAIAQSRAQTLGTVGPLWLASVYLLHTLGELMLSPVGLSMVSRVAPVRLASLLMGMWFLSSAVSNYLAGDLENLLAGSGVSPYVFLIGSSIGAGVVLLLISPWLNRLMSEGLEEPQAVPAGQPGSATA